MHEGHGSPLQHKEAPVRLSFYERCQRTEFQVVLEVNFTPEVLADDMRRVSGCPNKA